MFEIALQNRGDAVRVLYAVRIGDDIWVIHAFQKKSKTGIKTPQTEVDVIRERLKRLRGIDMSEEDFELVRGSDNVYRDFGRPDAGLALARARVAARIIQTLDARELSTREAARVTGVAHTEFSRIRNAQLRRFTLDRLIAILGRLESAVEVDVEFRSCAPEAMAQVTGV